MRTMKHRHILRTQGSHGLATRKGSIMALSLVVLVLIFAFAAFTVDFGMLTLTKGQIQNAADSAAHAATQELALSMGAGATVSATTAATNARTQAVNMVTRFRSGNLASTAADATRDVRLGYRQWNATTQRWDETWGVPPYNMAEVTVRRTASANAALPMSFARVLGIADQNVQAVSRASVAPVTGFQFNPNSSVALDILPIAVDNTTWNSLMTVISNNSSSTTFRDQYRWNSTTNSVSTGTDTIRELNIYPDQNSSLPPGNRGTVDLGSPNNSTSDLKRQIVSGLNAWDLSFFPNGSLQCSATSPLILNGDTGISAGIESSLQSIIGQVRAIPIFTSVSGPGNNAMYTVIKFVGVRIMAVKLTGGPTQRYVTVQPAQFTSPHTIRGNTTITVDSIVTKPYLIQ